MRNPDFNKTGSRKYFGDGNLQYLNVPFRIFIET